METALVSLIIKQPFFAILLGSMRKVKDEDCLGGIAATDGRTILYSSKFEEYSLQDRTFILIHEVMHGAFNHLTRRGERSTKRWNYACDYAVNSIIVNDCKIPLPKGLLYDSAYIGMSAEQIYNLLPESVGDPQGQFDGHIEIEGGEGQLLEGEWQQKVFSAYKSVGPGTLPGSITQLIDDIINPPINWKILLTELLTKLRSQEYKWTPPNRRLVQHGIYFPAKGRVDTVDLALAIDSSGSIQDDDLKVFLGSIRVLINQFENVRLRVLVCDTEITFDKTFDNGKEIKVQRDIKISGRGGTVFEPVFEAVKNCKGLVFLTDGYVSFPDKPKFPVVWVLTKKTSRGAANYPPYGRVGFL